MTTAGGNWKELVQAATEGDLAILKYHLDNGIDPNFQHPEYMTTPLLEAVRASQVESVKMLLEHPQNKADPTIVGHMEGSSPMEGAMQGKHHQIVDILLKVLPEDYENECLTIWMTGTFHRDLVAHFLTAGHCVVVTVELTELEESSALADTLRNETGNRKFWIQTLAAMKDFFGNSSSEEWRPSQVDVWLLKSAEPVKDIVAHLKVLSSWSNTFRGYKVKVLMMLDSQTFVGQQETQQQLSWLLANKEHNMTMAAMLEPTTWWDSMTYSFWYQTWCESVLSLLTQLAIERNGGGAHGKAYTYNRQALVLPALEGIDDSLIKQWRLMLDFLGETNLEGQTSKH